LIVILVNDFSSISSLNAFANACFVILLFDILYLPHNHITNIKKKIYCHAIFWDTIVNLVKNLTMILPTVIIFDACSRKKIQSFLI